MAITTIMFDLDGTLLPMDQDLFIKTYFGFLAKKVAPLGYDPEAFVNTIWAGTKAMIKNTGERRNEEVFWEVFANNLGRPSRETLETFDEFYEKDFPKARSVCSFEPRAAETVKQLKEKGYRLVLATNPVFPLAATKHRIGWAGLSLEDFEWYTTYENACHCKPNPDYYRDLLEKLSVTPEECLMVGNDADEDMAAATLNMKVFLLTNCLINKRNRDISGFPQGDFDALLAYIEKNS